MAKAPSKISRTSKRTTSRLEATPGSTETVNTPAEPAHAIQQQVVRFAQEAGRLAGTVRGKADALLDRRLLQEQLTRIRDSAAALLEHLSGDSSSADETPVKSRSGGKVDAPGKKHRKAPEPRRGVAHSDEVVAKMASARMRRPARRG